MNVPSVNVMIVTTPGTTEKSRAIDEVILVGMPVNRVLARDVELAVGPCPGSGRFRVGRATVNPHSSNVTGCLERPVDTALAVQNMPHSPSSARRGPSMGDTERQVPRAAHVHPAFDHRTASGPFSDVGQRAFPPGRARLLTIEQE